MFIGSMLFLCTLLAFVPDHTAGSFFERVWEYIVITFTFNFSGLSAEYGEPIIDVITSRLIVTFKLLGGAVLLTLLFSLPFGIWGALRPKSRIHQVLVYPVYLFSSIPVLIWSMLLLVLVFLGFSMVPLYDDLHGAGLVQGILVLSPPILALAIGDGMLYDTYRNIRTEVRSLLLKPWVKGLKSRGRSLYGHIIRGLVEPLTVSVSSKLTYLISGAIVVEMIFTWQGIGLLILDVLRREGTKDYPLLIAALMVIVILVIIGSFIREFVHIKMNPQNSGGR